jgi:signal transduction histidine kinase
MALLLSVILSLGVFLLDVLTAKGHAAQVLYVVPILMTLWSPQRLATPSVAALCSLLLVAGLLLSPAQTASPEESLFLVALPNRLYGIVIIGTATAISIHRKRSRTAVEQANAELERRVQERTAELSQANAELQQEIAERHRAEEELRRSNQELEDFAAVASHDLQAPLRSVSGYLELLDRRYKGTLNSSGKEFISAAVNGAKQMHTMINDLLKVARIRTRGAPFVAVQCSEILDRSLRNLAADIREKGASVTYASLPAVLGDGTQLVQLFQNLIGNAVKYAADRQPVVHVGVEQRGDDWLFSVRDNGIGIDPRHHKRIFEIFQRLHGAQEYAGTGIGLAVCRRIVERHNGRIWVESEPGKGSTFFFTLPRTSGSPDRRDDGDRDQGRAQ